MAFIAFIAFVAFIAGMMTGWGSGVTREVSVASAKLLSRLFVWMLHSPCVCSCCYKFTAGSKLGSLLSKILPCNLRPCKRDAGLRGKQRKSTREGFLGGVKEICRVFLEILPLWKILLKTKKNQGKTKKNLRKTNKNVFFLIFPCFSLCRPPLLLVLMCMRLIFDTPRS